MVNWFNPTWKDLESYAKELNGKYGVGRFVLYTAGSNYGIKDTKDGSVYGVLAIPALTAKLSKEQSIVKQKTRSSTMKKKLSHANSSDYLEHYGVLGMKWGVRKDPDKAYNRASNKLSKLDKKVVDAEARISKANEKSLKKRQKADTAILFKKHKARKAASSIRSINREHLNLQRKAAKAEKWYKNMENTFRDVKLSSIDPSYKALGKKYANIKIDEMMANVMSDVSMKQLESYYRDRGR